jgi:glucose-6-phosphate 1-dehydrogenase
MRELLAFIVRKKFTHWSWGIVQRLLEAPPPVNRYAPSSWGPEQVDALVQGHSNWHEPWTDGT